MADLQPRIAELQKKYGGDKARLAEEQQKLYREAGANPLGGCLPTLVQFPIWISLYQSINSILADTPLELVNLGKNVYSGFDAIARIIPLQRHFLGMDLAQPDPSPFILPVLVASTMWLQQKIMAQPTSDPQQASMNQSMQLMMPLMFGYMTTQFASGLAIYFVISNIIGTTIHWAITRFEGSMAGDVSEAVDTSKSKGKAPNGSKKRRTGKR
jgi:YidC/Oxa1 family membrane protein insertase